MYDFAYWIAARAALVNDTFDVHGLQAVNRRSLQISKKVEFDGCKRGGFLVIYPLLYP